jgi:Short C-terminal domain/Phospholipase_D-nuclease N-terminal
MLAYDYPLLSVFFSLLWFFLFVLWFWLLITILADIFRSHDLEGFSKTLWVLFVIFLPFLGVFVYLIARGQKMHEHAAKDVADSDAAFKQYVQQTAPTTSTADQLAKLAELRDRGVLTPEEFDAQKAKILA